MKNTGNNRRTSNLLANILFILVITFMITFTFTAVDGYIRDKGVDSRKELMISVDKLSHKQDSLINLMDSLNMNK